MASSIPPSVEWPPDGELTLDWLVRLGETLELAAAGLPPNRMPDVVPVAVADSIIARASKLLHREPNCLILNPAGQCDRVVLVGDLHGQFHDLLHLLRLTGHPDDATMFVFNGDYVDRGAWGFETYLFLLSWKVLLPHRMFLLRGNHETKFCTSVYGFEKEISVKYEDQSKHLYRKLLGCFEGHPLAAVIAGNVFMAHGGLFRRSEPPASSCRSKHFKRPQPDKALKLGTLEDLATARRGVLDPSATAASIICGDILWSDPSLKPGLFSNDVRGIGLLFGPDCTQEFLATHKLKLIIRSHEGPDAREKRPEMQKMDKGYTIDHVVEAGKLITLFSAPDYPQFQASSVRYQNKAAYIVLEPPDFCEPQLHVFEAVLPRPKVTPYYDHVNVADSDDELEMKNSS